MNHEIQKLVQAAFKRGYNVGLNEAISQVAGASDDGWEDEFADWYEENSREQEAEKTNE